MSQSNPTRSEPTHWAIMNASGNVLAWYRDYAEAKREFDAMQGGEFLSLVGFTAPGVPA